MNIDPKDKYEKELRRPLDPDDFESYIVDGIAPSPFQYPRDRSPDDIEEEPDVEEEDLPETGT